MDVVSRVRRVRRCPPWASGIVGDVASGVPAVTLKQLHAALPPWIRPRLPRGGREWAAAAVVVVAAAGIVHDLASTIIRVLAFVLPVAIPVSWLVASWRRRRYDGAAAARAAGLSYSPAQIDAMSPTAFEHAVRDLMIRDGIAARHVGQRGDQAADVIGRDTTGRVVVVQCKHTTTESRVGSRVMYEVNGTAGPVHGADVAVVVTNGAFTRNASEFAARHGIHLIDRERLDRWASRGSSLHTLLGLREHVQAG